MDTTYDVSIWSIYVYNGKRKDTYYVPWKVGDNRFKERFNTEPLAVSFRSELIAAASKGEAFDLTSGLPVSKARALAEATKSETNWFPFAAQYVEIKWPEASPTHRRSIAEALTTITTSLLATRRGKPADTTLRKACKTMFSLNLQRKPIDETTKAAIEWLNNNTLPVSALGTPDILRAVLTAIGSKRNGEMAATTTTRRKRMTLYNILDFATEKELLGKNPLIDAKKSTKSQASVLRQVDRRSVVNPIQARTLLAAIGQREPSGPRLVAFFGLMYYAALRPEEAAALRKEHMSLPPMSWSDEHERWEFAENDEGWGELHLECARPEIEAVWTDSDNNDEERGLKHRDPHEGRSVPCPPELTALLHDHLAKYGTAPDGRLFYGLRNGGRIGSTVYGRAWAAARATVFTPEVQASPLAKRPYDLRHAAVSTWIKAGVEIPRVAEWAGHSVAVLMRVYAKFIDGGEHAARARVAEALRG